ncbi:hypothetical protein DMX09_25150 [Pseudomonas protegens]|nr:hypothetical protein DMX09_25150 [Pseudomonas protegens]
MPRNNCSTHTRSLPSPPDCPCYRHWLASEDVPKSSDFFASKPASVTPTAPAGAWQPAKAPDGNALKEL